MDSRTDIALSALKSEPREARGTAGRSGLHIARIAVAGEVGTLAHAISAWLGLAAGRRVKWNPFVILVAEAGVGLALTTPIIYYLAVCDEVSCSAVGNSTSRQMVVMDSLGGQGNSDRKSLAMEGNIEGLGQRLGEASKDKGQRLRLRVGELQVLDGGNSERKHRRVHRR
jgi:hypothetical protein